MNGQRAWKLRDLTGISMDSSNCPILWWNVYFLLPDHHRRTFLVWRLIPCILMCLYARARTPTLYMFRGVPFDAFMYHQLNEYGKYELISSCLVIWIFLTITGDVVLNTFMLTSSPFDSCLFGRLKINYRRKLKGLWDARLLHTKNFSWRGWRRILAQ